MLYHPRNFPFSLHRCALFLAIALAGCGDFCVTGFSVNGTGNVTINGGNPPPPCTLPHVNTMMRTVALKTRVCAGCTSAARAEHVFVTLQGIQLRAEAREEAGASTWIEIAPEFAGRPRQIDLIGDSLSEVLRENTLIPAGSYREVRLALFGGSPENVEKTFSENACGGMRWNCVVRPGGLVEELVPPNDDSTLRVPIDAANGSGAFVLPPDSKVELQLRLEPRQVFSSPATGGWKPQIVLAGHATIQPQKFSGSAKVTSD